MAFGDIAEDRHVGGPQHVGPDHDVHAQVLAERQQLPVEIFRGEARGLQRIAAQEGQELVHVRLAARVVVGNLFLPAEQHMRGVGEHHQLRSRRHRPRRSGRRSAATGAAARAGWTRLARSACRRSKSNPCRCRAGCGTSRTGCAGRPATPAAGRSSAGRRGRRQKAPGSVCVPVAVGRSMRLPVVEGECEVVAVDHAFHEVGRAGAGTAVTHTMCSCVPTATVWRWPDGHRRVERIQHRERDVAAHAHRQPDRHRCGRHLAQYRAGENPRFTAE